MRRVVVTGMSGVTALGNDWSHVRSALQEGHTAIRRMEAWEAFADLHTRLAGPIQDFDVDARYGRKKLRSMGPVSKMSVFAAEMALAQANLLGDPILSSGRVGVSFGSSFGSTNPVIAFSKMLTEGTSRNLSATSYIKMMSHTAPVNIGVFFKLRGRVIPTSSACTSGSQGIGYAYEAIKFGKQDIMVAGGGEELCPSMAAVFDTLYATSTKNDTPHLTPRPFDRDRDGMVVGEGAGVLILEDYEHAKARGATIKAEIVGFGTNSDGHHITQPQQETMEAAMKTALEDANLPAEAIDIVNGHGTATDHGDIAESHATSSVLGEQTPLHTLKGNFGHSLGACGATEAWLGLEMMAEDWFSPIANLENIDPNCAPIDYIKGSIRPLQAEYLMSNNFAFGGINTSLIFRRVA